jgi:nucleoside-diphosphate-sugar epimerase
MNIACQKSFSLLDLVRALNSILHTQIEPLFEEGRRGEVKHSLADITLASKMIKYAPEVEWEEGLERTVEWYKNKLM